MYDNLKPLILEHARNEAPRECCGLIVVKNGRDFYVPCKNTSIKNDQFIINAGEFAAAESSGTIMAIVHSHPNSSAQPSQSDLTSCEASKLPWIICSLPSQNFYEFSPSGYKAPLIGRQFHYGVLDCFSLMRDWYLQEKNIKLDDFPSREWEWWKRGRDLVGENFKKWGFEIIPEPSEVGDLILMQIKATVPNHFGIYLGSNIMLHHAEGRLSSKDVYGGYWLKNTRYFLRHRP